MNIHPAKRAVIIYPYLRLTKLQERSFTIQICPPDVIRQSEILLHHFADRTGAPVFVFYYFFGGLYHT